MTRHVHFYHALQSRAVGARILLEELGADYTVHLLDLKKGEQRQDAYLAVNPLGKVPAIVHDGALVTEQPAVYLYLADLYPEAGLAPAIGDPLRGPYLRWMVLYGSSFEPAVVDKAYKREPVGASTSPYGDFDTVFATLCAQLEKGPWMLGERFTAVDVLWGTALRWITGFGLVEATPKIKDYVERVGARPAARRATELDAALAA
ncbi:MAG TPA: glutathione S-transferase family protein [Telluria sp.]|nr:glutathione S-transferase family protein [Telluria sp.]